MEQRIPTFHARQITEDEYLRREEAAKERHEFRDGRIVDMAGGTEEHSDIAGNLIRHFRNRLEGKLCKAYGSDLRVRVSEKGDYCYPDVTVACGPLEFHNPPSRSNLLNPRLVVEVTSVSSEADDRGDKFTLYRNNESLQEYVLVSSFRQQVETFYKMPDGVWAIGATITKPLDVVRFRSLEIEMLLADIYSGVQLPEEKPKSQPTDS